jgi:hypothetical protein
LKLLIGLNKLFCSGGDEQTSIFLPPPAPCMDCHIDSLDLVSFDWHEDLMEKIEFVKHQIHHR